MFLQGTDIRQEWQPPAQMAFQYSLDTDSNHQGTEDWGGLPSQVIVKNW